jgi:UDP:flavonoid glycosyltransferase YjiC (YdhE family)
VRLLVTPSPAMGHFVPVVATAWAARAAGHDVLVAAAGPTVDACAHAGLPAFDAAPGLDLHELIRTHRHGSRIYAAASDQMADVTVRVARDWRPDLVLSTPVQATGALVAGLLSVPLMRQGFGLSMGRKMAGVVVDGVRATFERHGLRGPAPDPAAELDPCPATMARRPPTTTTWSTRYIPYGGGGGLPGWLLEPPGDRPRIGVSVGTLVPYVVGLGSLAGVIDAAREMDAELVLALGGADPGQLGALPPNVRAMSWLPLPSLVPTCAAFVHHGGAGTTMNALLEGVPQLVLPQISDGFANAEAVVRRGVGISGDADTADAAFVLVALRRLLEDGGIRRAVDEVRSEIACMPPPSELVTRFADLRAV